jgi:exopolysaccharide/PEP-CTERM locus tyrosine autokinase
MSLVEQALKKIQASRSANPPAAAARPLAGSSQAPKPTSAEFVRAVPERSEPERVKPVVKIDLNALRRVGLLCPVEQERQLAGEYRQIKRPLISSALGRGVPKLENGHLIMLASALPGDGKTFTSINLALSLALEKDISVLLVDADVAKPHISGALGVGRELGLLDVLRDERLDVESLILPTDVPALSILPAGQPSNTATELLASSRMETVVAQIGARDPNRIVLFDSPPLLLTTESRALASVVGNIVIVVRAGVTPQRAVLEALELLGDGKTIALVLNQSDESSRLGYYQHYGQQPAAEGGN